MVPVYQYVFCGYCTGYTGIGYEYNSTIALACGLLVRSGSTSATTVALYCVVLALVYEVVLSVYGSTSMLVILVLYMLVLV